MLGLKETRIKCCLKEGWLSALKNSWMEEARNGATSWGGTTSGHREARGGSTNARPRGTARHGFYGIWRLGYVWSHESTLRTLIEQGQYGIESLKRRNLESGNVQKGF